MIILEKAKFSSTQINLPESLREYIQVWIDKHIPLAFFDPTESNGPDLHVTIKYGLHTQNVNDLIPVVKDFGPITVWLGTLSAFYNETDVLKIEVFSPDLHRLNKLICNNLEYTDTHLGYIPHITLGYLKKGTADPYIGKTDFNGIKFTSPFIWFSDTNENKTKISLI